MTVNELIEKLREFDGDLSVESIAYGDAGFGGCGCCSSGPDYEYDEVSDPYLAQGTIWKHVPDKRAELGFRQVCQPGEVVRIDAR